MIRDYPNQTKEYVIHCLKTVVPDVFNITHIATDNAPVSQKMIAQMLKRFTEEGLIRRLEEKADKGRFQYEMTNEGNKVTERSTGFNLDLHLKQKNIRIIKPSVWASI